MPDIQQDDRRNSTTKSARVFPRSRNHERPVAAASPSTTHEWLRNFVAHEIKFRSCWSIERSSVPRKSFCLAKPVSGHINIPFFETDGRFVHPNTAKRQGTP
jgi:hypothetical protein